MHTREMAGEIYFIGIAGPSGAGKTHLALHLAAALPARVIGLDRYYRDLSQLPLAERAGMNFDAPEALEHELLIRQIARLRNNETVRLPVYDFASHARIAKTEIFPPGKIVIVEGLFTLYWPMLRALLDTKIYVDTDDQACLARRKERDVRQRGRSLESVERQYVETVAPMADRYVRPTMAHADLVVSGEDRVENAVARVVEHCRQHAGCGRVAE